MDILHIATTTWKSNEDRFLVSLPLFFGYLLGSCLSLRIWIAAQKVPALVRSDSELPKDVEKDLEKAEAELMDLMKDKSAQIILLFVIGFMFLSLVLFLIWEPFRYAILALFAMRYVYPVTVFPLFFFGFRLSVHRTGGGGLTTLWSERNPSMDKRLFSVIILLSLGCQIIVIWLRSNIGASVMLGMALCALEVLDRSQKVSIRNIIYGIVIGETILLLLYKVQTDKKAGNNNTAESDNFSDWIYIVFATLPLASFFSLFLRLDCANHIASIEATQGSPVDIVLEEVPTSEITSLRSGQRTTGVIVPSCIPFAFKPPYFISAFLAWLLANFALVQLTNHGLLSYSGRFAHALGLFVIAPPLMILSAAVVSIFRGEMGRLWRFNGQYDANPINPVSDNEKVGQLVDVEETAA